MPIEIVYSDEAVEDLKDLRAFDRSAILDQIEQFLAVNPTLESKAKVKRLKEPAPTQYRLRVGEYRVFYDVEEQTVSVFRVLSKEASLVYLRGET
ncbi:MAG: type II toxin-antitoxin system RelE/ParE family toxin [Planctomycetes bacterium]|nr:type II toxin-antitoxin system RelE/ParE family toxin [Planctomycetota bacterium]